MNRDDELIRSMYQNSGLDRRGRHATAALASLRPAMRRARRRRQFVVGAAATMIVGTGTMGVLALDAAVRQPELRTYTTETAPAPDFDGNEDASDRIVADPPVDSTEADDADRSGSEATTTSAAPEPDPTTTLSVGEPVSVPPTEPDEPTTIPSVVTLAPVPATTAPPINQPTSPTTTPTVAPMPTSTTPTSGPTTTVDPATIPRLPGEELVESMCGDIVIDVDGDEVVLVRTLPEPGFETDVKSDGPENVEVGYHLANDECEIKARVESGKLVIEVKNPEKRSRNEKSSGN